MFISPLFSFILLSFNLFFSFHFFLYPYHIHIISLHSFSFVTTTQEDLKLKREDCIKSREKIAEELEENQQAFNTLKQDKEKALAKFEHYARN